jgi:hypothetical protein
MDCDSLSASSSTVGIINNTNKGSDNNSTFNVSLDEIMDSIKIKPECLISINRMQKLCEQIQLSYNNNQDIINNPTLQREVFDLIEKVYFYDFNSKQLEEQIDCKNTFEFELKKYKDPLYNFNLIEIKKNLKRLQIQNEIVCRKVSDVILQNSHAYSVELQRVSDFKTLLEDSAQICSISRRFLSMTQSVFIMSTLKLIKNNIKKTNLTNTLKSIEAIKELVIKKKLEIKIENTS